MDFLQSSAWEEMIKPIKITGMYILLCYFKSILTLYYWSFLFFSLKTMITPIPKLHFICSAIPPSLPLTSTKPEKKKLTLEKIMSHVPRCTPSLSDIFPKTINTGSPRQTISTYMYFQKSDHYTRNFLPFSKHRNYDRNHIQSWPEAKLCSSQNVSYFIICVVLFSPFPSSGTTPPLPKMSLAPRTFMISLTPMIWPKSTLRNYFKNPSQQTCKGPAQVWGISKPLYSKDTVQRAIDIN